MTLVLPGNAAIFRCRVLHERLQPRRHKFQYGIFMLYLDLDNLEMPGGGPLFAVNAPALVSFHEVDHFVDHFKDDSAARVSLAAKIRRLAQANGIEAVASIWLLTMPRILGYVFNPVSFYFLFDKNKNAVACVVEVSNTFREMKMYLVQERQEKIFRLQVPKHFYVSPFAGLDDRFDFILAAPADGRLHISINTLGAEDTNKILLSSLSGYSIPFSRGQIVLNFLQYPLLTLKVIAMIHFQALLLFLKKVPFSQKEENPHLQTDVLNPDHKEKSYARAKIQG
ncbi:MAG: DUF1365 family protein [Cyanobacteria bacterium REEB67]|nr:DUF1365 family protein [Cyanobacteria bacterium REEB67]